MPIPQNAQYRLPAGINCDCSGAQWFTEAFRHGSKTYQCKKKAIYNSIFHILLQRTRTNGIFKVQGTLKHFVKSASKETILQSYV